MAQNPAVKVIERLAKRAKADIYLYSAPMNLRAVNQLRTLVCRKASREENCIIFYSTYGGDADAAYRLASCLRHRYKHVTAQIFGFCKSAGTLATIGADEIVFGDFGELGPLDVQMTKPDELMPTSSGLDIFQAMGVLTHSAFEAFESYFVSIIESSQGHISAKTSAEIARELAVGLFAPMTGQIDPERLGEVQRAITVANAYGNKLNAKNLKRGALERLVQGYPTHGFVIDLDEAKSLFEKVRSADQLEQQVAAFLPSLRQPSTEPIVVDVRQMFATMKGSKNVAQPKEERRLRKQPKAARKSRASVPPASSGRSGNVAELKRDAARNTTATEEDNYPRRNQSGKNPRPSIRPPVAIGE